MCFFCDECRADKALKRFKELKRQSDLILQFLYKINEKVQEQKIVFSSLGRDVAAVGDGVKRIDIGVENLGQAIQSSKSDLNGSLEKLCFSVGPNLKDGVQSVEDGLVDLKKSLQVSDGVVKEKLEKVQSIIETKTAPVQNISGSYAQVLKSNVQPICIIKPKNNKQDKKTTRDEVMKKIDPVSVGVSGLRATGAGGMAIVCNSQKAVEGVREIAERELGDDYSISIPKPLFPRLKVSGLSERLDDDEFLRRFCTQNNFGEHSDGIRVVAIRNTRKGRFYDAIVELHPYVYRDLLKKQRINIGWDTCYISDAVNVRRCAKCCSYAHSAKQCPNEESLCCLRCAGPHYAKDCQSDTLCCRNCKYACEKLGVRVNMDHRVDDPSCTMYLRALRKLKQRISFD